MVKTVIKPLKPLYPERECYTNVFTWADYISGFLHCDCVNNIKKYIIDTREDTITIEQEISGWFYERLKELESNGDLKIEIL